MMFNIWDLVSFVAGLICFSVLVWEVGLSLPD